MEDSSYRQGSFPFISAILIPLISAIHIPVISIILIPVSDIFRSLLSVRDGFPHGYLHRNAASI